MADSDAGKNIEPGKPDESLFLDLIVLTEPTGRMPKNADPLPKAEVDILRRWIEQGAKSGGLDPNAELVGAGRPREPAGCSCGLPDARAGLGPGVPARRSRAGDRRLSRGHDLGLLERQAPSPDPRPGPADARAGLQRRRIIAGRRGRDARRVGRADPGRSEGKPAASGHRLGLRYLPRGDVSARMGHWSRSRGPIGPCGSTKS